MSEEHHPTRSTEAFFGRRKGKPLKPRQAALYSEQLPKWRIAVEKSAAPKGLQSLFDANVKTVRLEIGFGGGEHLINEAGRFPETGFVGVEPFVNSMAKFLANAADRKMSNIRVYDDDATQLLDWLPDGSINGIDLFYPDPWPKMKHWKRRFVNQVNLTRFARVMKKDSLFRFASDIDTYVNWTLNHCHKHRSFDWIVTNARDWKTPYDAWPGTRYEAKAFQEGRKPAYLTFKRV